jgi:lia operon protein LiaG
MSRTVAVLALSTILAGVAAGQTETKTVKGAAIAIYNIAGRMRAVAGTGDAVSVEITRGGADASKLRVETGTITGRETMRIVYPSDRIVYPNGRYGRSRTTLNVRPDGTFGDGGNWDEWRNRDRVEVSSYGSGLEAYADLLVKIPRGQKVDLYLAVGRVEVSNVEGDLLVDVSAAEVDVAGLKGNLVLDTGSGRVSVRDVTGNADIDTGSGGILLDRVSGDVLRIDSGSGGIEGNDITVREFNADVGSGGLRIYRMRAPNVVAETGSGGIHLELLSEIQRLDVETGSGGATIRLPASLSAEIEAETGSGGFSTDFEISTRRFSRNHVQGRIGDGRGRVRIEAGSGTVRLLKGSSQ